MAHVIGLKVETIDPRRRNELLEAITELLSDHLAGADEATLTFTREAKTSLGKRKVTDTVTISEHDPVSFADLEAGIDLSLPMDALWTGQRATKAA